MNDSAFKNYPLLFWTHNRFYIIQSGGYRAGKSRQAYCSYCIRETLIKYGGTHLISMEERTFSLGWKQWVTSWTRPLRILIKGNPKKPKGNPSKRRKNNIVFYWGYMTVCDWVHREVFFVRINRCPLIIGLMRKHMSFSSWLTKLSVI